MAAINRRALAPIEQCQKALWNPASFSFNRAPQDNDEWEDFQYMLKAYAYKALQ